MFTLRDPHREHQDGAILLPQHLPDAPLQALPPDQAAVNLLQQRDVPPRDRQGRDQDSTLQEPEAAEQQDCAQLGLSGPFNARTNQAHQARHREKALDSHCKCDRLEPFRDLEAVSESAGVPGDRSSKWPL